MFSFFRWLNLLSLDAVLIALMWQEVFARTAMVALRWEERALLGISVWIIYVTDHFCDVMTKEYFPTKFPLPNKAPRHQYVKSHRLLLGSFLVGALCINVWLLVHFSRNLLIAGILLAAVAAGYLMLNHFFLQCNRWLNGREIIISLIFAIGCALAPIVQSHQPWLLLPWIMLFSIVAFINCTLIARMERKVSIVAVAPQWFFSQRSIFLICFVMLLCAFISPAIGKALCWSFLGLAFIPIIARRFGYETASLAADQVLFFGALLSLVG